MEPSTTLLNEMNVGTFSYHDNDDAAQPISTIQLSSLTTDISTIISSGVSPRSTDVIHTQKLFIGSIIQQGHTNNPSSHTPFGTPPILSLGPRLPYMPNGGSTVRMSSVPMFRPTGNPIPIRSIHRVPPPLTVKANSMFVPPQHGSVGNKAVTYAVVSQPVIRPPLLVKVGSIQPGQRTPIHLSNVQNQSEAQPTMRAATGGGRQQIIVRQQTIAPGVSLPQRIASMPVRPQVSSSVMKIATSTGNFIVVPRPAVLSPVKQIATIPVVVGERASVPLSSFRCPVPSGARFTAIPRLGITICKPPNNVSSAPLSMDSRFPPTPSMGSTFVLPSNVNLGAPDGARQNSVSTDGKGTEQVPLLLRTTQVPLTLVKSATKPLVAQAVTTTSNRLIVEVRNTQANIGAPTVVSTSYPLESKTSTQNKLIVNVRSTLSNARFPGVVGGPIVTNVLVAAPVLSTTTTTNKLIAICRTPQSSVSVDRPVSSSSSDSLDVITTNSPAVTAELKKTNASPSVGSSSSGMTTMNGAISKSVIESDLDPMCKNQILPVPKNGPLAVAVKRLSAIDVNTSVAGQPVENLSPPMITGGNFFPVVKSMPLTVTGKSMPLTVTEKPHAVVGSSSTFVAGQPVKSQLSPSFLQQRPSEKLAQVVYGRPVSKTTDRRIPEPIYSEEPHSKRSRMEMIPPPLTLSDSQVIPYH